ncbi:hypothetical protein ACQP25_01840 [Microtetraspora malaysiensis]|uniref:hypothetical protein n=1 Tax=Microtetraspora malaysiensis TaxID=161358 RepID=UPI003D9382ED
MTKFRSQVGRLEFGHRRSEFVGEDTGDGGMGARRPATVNPDTHLPDSGQN